MTRRVWHVEDGCPHCAGEAVDNWREEKDMIWAAGAILLATMGFAAAMFDLGGIAYLLGGAAGIVVGRLKWREP